MAGFTSKQLMAYDKIDDSSIDYIYTPDTNIATKAKKKLWEKGEWVEKTFIKMMPPNRMRGIQSAMELWCIKYYGEPAYQGAWFKAGEYIIMDEKTYVHWKLCE
jgi:hypothetical protein